MTNEKIGFDKQKKIDFISVHSSVHWSLSFFLWPVLWTEWVWYLENITHNTTQLNIYWLPWKKFFVIFVMLKNRMLHWITYFHWYASTQKHAARLHTFLILDFWSFFFSLGDNVVVVVVLVAFQKKSSCNSSYNIFFVNVAVRITKLVYM